MMFDCCLGCCCLLMMLIFDLWVDAVVCLFGGSLHFVRSL